MHVEGQNPSRLKKWLAELRPHALWDALKEMLRYIILLIVSGIWSAFQWFHHQYGLLFVLGLCALVVSLVTIGMLIERKRQSGIAIVARLATLAIALLCVGAVLTVFAMKRPDNLPQPTSAQQSPTIQNTSQTSVKQHSQTEQIPQSERNNPNVTVWVNTASGVYHCPGSQWYERTKKGTHMTQAQAQAQGYRPAYYRVCQ